MFTSNGELFFYLLSLLPHIYLVYFKRNMTYTKYMKTVTYIIYYEVTFP